MSLVSCWGVLVTSRDESKEKLARLGPGALTECRDGFESQCQIQLYSGLHIPQLGPPSEIAKILRSRKK